MSAPNDLILYHYPFSPFARRVSWYLTLREIPYAQCIQPVALPRPDLEAIGVAYRRIPLLAHGSSIYCDTALIIDHLESAFPSSHLAPTTPEQQTLQKLLRSWTIDGIFVRAAQALPPDLPLMKDPKFIKDREQYTGRSWSQESVKEWRPEALTHLRDAFDFLEKGLLGDGRDWILNTEKPTLADIEAVWPFAWLIDLKVALPEDIFSKETYPIVFAWVDRFNRAIKEAKKRLSDKKLSGEEATKIILETKNTPKMSGPSQNADPKDPSGLREGALIESWPTDTGFKNRDRGRLIRLSHGECVFENDRGLWIHHPRWNFKIREIKEKTKEAPKI